MHITCAYFVPDAQILRALIEAAHRGVDVKIILPGVTDVGMVFYAAQSFYSEMLACGINEAALMMEQGICDRPADMDLAMITGTGFPPYRGGILRHADQWGLAKVHAKLVELEKKYGPRFAPAQLVKTMAQEGQTFYQDRH